MDWTILAGLSEGDRRAVIDASVRRTYRRNEVVFRQGDAGRALHLLAAGRVAIQVSTANGNLATIGILGPGSHFGEQALVGGSGGRMATVIALERAEALSLDRRAFEQLRAVHPEIDRVLVTALSERVNRLTDQLVEVLFMPAEVRVRRRLADLTAVYDAGRDGGIVVGLTQEELAMLAGTSRPTVNRVLAELVDDGIVAVRRGGVEVLDAPRLLGRSDRA